ncbi:MAG TPA: hypothetical protein PLL77_14870 [Pyrinomonadaceae bacterium]|nr:hypothetical protein [Pyrinomonadaceae bacterium]
MILFTLPNVDPIPLPAPVWLFKVLHIATLMLHFIAVQMMLGGLTMATLWNIFGKRDSEMRAVSNSMVKKLPTVMIYVINFGVPPLLFAQVLYGQALYTSSVVMGAYWIAVIFLLIAGYFLLYKAADRADENKSWWWMGLTSLVLLAYIARIYSTNMTLMLRPEEWVSLYQQSGGSGTVLPHGDPTVLPRFLFMTIGSLGLAGIFAVLLGLYFDHKETVRDFFVRFGGAIGAVFFVVQMLLGFWVYSAQQAIVQEGLWASSLGFYGTMIWAVFSVIAVGASIGTVISRSTAKFTGWIAAISAVLSTAGTVLVRDVIRDQTLLAKGFDVWNRNVVANWSVVVIFLVLFVGALGLIGYLLYAVNRSMKEVKEQNA